MTVEAIVLRAAGQNCDRESEFALRLAGANATRLHVNQLKKDPQRLDDFDILLIPGGFSYGDDLGAGAIFGNELATGLRQPMERFIEAGKLIIGICNGFQVLVRTGLLPGLTRWRREATLTTNDSHRFEDRWVHLRACDNRSMLTRNGDMMYLPVAHAEGKLVCRDEETLDRLKNNGQILFRYSDPQGRPDGYRSNPNGSVDHIAGLCDPSGHVIGMMPHPERHCLPHQHPAWTREGCREQGDGMLIFQRAVEYVRARG